MRATTGFIRLFIRGLAWDAEAGSATFYDTLKAASQARLTTSSKGKILVGTASGGTSVTYTLPPMGDLTEQDLAEVCSALLDEVDALIAEDAGITNDEILAALLARFKPIRSYQSNFSGLRV